MPVAAGRDPLDIHPDFASDGCTMWFDGTWRKCCEDHDLDFYLNQVTMQSHVKLGVCVVQKGGDPVIATAMILATAAYWMSTLVRNRIRRKPANPG